MGVQRQAHDPGDPLQEAKGFLLSYLFAQSSPGITEEQ